jgi:hypothetical protein
MCLFYADCKHSLCKKLQYFLKTQGLVNHVGQPLIKHANRSNARNIRLTSLLK